MPVFSIDELPHPEAESFRFPGAVESCEVAFG